MLLNTLLLLLAAPPPDPAPGFDWMKEGALAIIVVTPIAVRLMVHLAFFVVERIPKWALPTAAVVLATVVEYLTGIATANPILAAAITLAAIGLREIIDRFFTKPLGLGDRLSVSDGNYLRRRS